MAAHSSSEVAVVISLEASRVSNASAIAEQLSSMGLNNVRILANIGAVTGTCDPSVMMKLRGVSGVVAIEQSGDFQIVPPGSDVQ